MDESYESARRILSEHMDKLHEVARVLIEKEKISGEEFRDIMESSGVDYDADPDTGADDAGAQAPAAAETPADAGTDGSADAAEDAAPPQA